MSQAIFARVALVLMLCIIFSCSDTTNQDLFKSLSPEVSGFDFNNVITESDSINAYSFLYAYNGSGVGIGDLDNDGLQDIVMGGNMVSSQIFINQGEMQFEALASSAGFLTDQWVHGVSLVDINADGLLDIYLSIGGKTPSEKTKNQLFINQGGLKFEESAESFGLDLQSLSTHTIFFDYDGDNDLDAYVLNYENNPNKDPNIIKPKTYDAESVSQDRLMRNDGGVFVDVTKAAGINQEGYGLGVHATDFNDDGWLDIYVSNDFAYDDLLYINQGDGSFKESLAQYFKHTSNFGMGMDVADINNDGLKDIYQVDMLPEDNRRQKKLLSGMNYDRQQMLIARGYTPQYMRNSLQLNAGTETFQEVGYLAGVSNTDWSWSPLIADLNNDGFKDLYITNGYVKDVTDVDFRDYVIDETRKRNVNFDENIIITALEELKGEKTSNYTYLNVNGIKFEKINGRSGADAPSFSTGSAYGDLDNDGDLDLVVNNLNDPSFLFENQTAKTKNFFQLKLVDGEQPLDRIGIEVSLYANGQRQHAEWNPYRGFQSTSEWLIHFGLNENQLIDSLMIEWGDGTHSTLKELELNTRLTIDQNEVERQKISKSSNSTDFFEDLTQGYNFEYEHHESPYVDFKGEALIPHKLSTEGPIAIVGDVNMDGMEDVFIGGAAGEPSVLMIQSQHIDGPKFERRVLEEGLQSEVRDAAFFDFDNDGDLDLYVVNGSNEHYEKTALYKDLLLLNDGTGKFVDHSEKLPISSHSGGAIAPYDFDKDGDIDLFVGGGLNPGNYPLPGTSMFLINENGVYKDMIDKVGPDLTEAGMIKSAIWSDLTGNGQAELVVTGEFMSVEVYEVKGDQLIRSTASQDLDAYVGWWNDIKIVDIDNDGDQDIVAANLGLNTRYKASQEYPLNVYAQDFDANGTLDAILTFFIDGKEYPIPDRALITQQIPKVKKKFTSNITYAEATIEKVFPRTVLNNTYQLSATYFKTAIFENNGQGGFHLVELPLDAQFSRVNSILVWDIDGDGLKDIVLGGNSNATEVFTGNYDAQSSLILKNAGGLNFEAISTFGTGFPDDGVITDLKLLHIDNEEVILSLKHNSEAALNKLSQLDILTQSRR